MHILWFVSLLLNFLFPSCTVYSALVLWTFSGFYGILVSGFLRSKNMCTEGGGNVISVSQIANILLPWTGSELLQKLEADCELLVRTLNAFSGCDLHELHERLTLTLFGAVRRATNGSMVVSPDGGYPVRMNTDDFSDIADDMLLPLLLTFPVDEKHLQLLKAFSMQQASLSALRTLHTRFASLQTQAELDTIAHIAKGSYPPFRLLGWLYPSP